jgi:hypothetical protein
VRTALVLNSWFGRIRSSAEDWWELGAAEGGGLAMNDGVASCIAVLRSVFDHLDTKGQKLFRLEDDDLVERLRPYADALGEYLGSLSESDRRLYRELRGVQGVTARTRRCQQAIRERIPTFDPPGLEEFMKLEKAETNRKAKEIIDRMEITLQETVLDELRREYNVDGAQWWIDGIPRTVRTKVAVRFNEDDGRRGGQEYYLDLIDYRTIIQQNWQLFESLLGYGKSNTSKDKRTAWLNELNDLRRIVAHASAGRAVTLEQLAQLEVYDSWLLCQVSALPGTEVNALEEPEQ